MSYQGDYLAASLVVFNFNTSSFSDGSPITLGGTPALSVYKNSTTESTAGVTLTVDYDTRTGMHHVVIDTSADGTFYAAGNDFDVIITTGTVGGTSVVGKKVGSFSLENRCQKADVRKVAGNNIITPNVNGALPVDVVYVGGVVASPAGTVDANVVSIADSGLANLFETTMTNYQVSAAKQSLCGAVLKLTSKFALNESANLATTYQIDGVTAFMQQAIVTDSTLVAVKSLGVGS